MTEKNDGFLPESYDVPKGDSNFMKLEDGESRFRALSKPLLGWLDWKDNKPIRFPMDQKPAAPVDPEKPIKHFWAFVVFDYSDNKIKVLEITQKTVQKSMSLLSKDKDWGLPFCYDIKVTRTGAQLETKYIVNPVPPSPVTEEIKAAYLAKPCNLDKLFASGDPFTDAKASTEAPPF